MIVDILTLFPEMFAPVTTSSILKRAVARKILDVNLTNIRDYAYCKHRVVDDYPFGGGAGMVMKPEPIVLAVESALERARARGVVNSRVILMSPAGKTYNQAAATRLSTSEHLVFICGHYEGVDERVSQLVVDEEISIGDYVLTGGELPAMVVVDSVARLLPGVLGSDESSLDESFTASLLEYPQYTRPREFRGITVPEVLLSGNHKEIAKWRRTQSLQRTLARRKDLVSKPLPKVDEELLRQAPKDSMINQNPGRRVNSGNIEEH